MTTQIQVVAPRVTVKHVIAATADVTGTPAADLLGRSQIEPLRLHRKCMQAAAVRVTGCAARVARSTGRYCNTLVRATLDNVANDNPELVARITERAIELARDPNAPPVKERAAPPCMRAVIVAAAQVTGSSPRDLLAAGQRAPWYGYNLAMQAAARRCGLTTSAIARALRRNPQTITGRAGRFDRINEQHGPLVEQIVRRANELARLPIVDLERLARGVVLASPPSDATPETVRRAVLAHRVRENGGEYVQ